eukprot:m.980642 g.980642  ORF g.980642 m.980642 type:complete len:98 (-) comp23969_c0_seq13:1182-1475(-)
MGRDRGRDVNNANYHLGPRSALVSHVLTRWPTNFSTNTREQNIAWLVADLSAQLAQRQGTGPWFLQAMALSWAYTPSDIKEIVPWLTPSHDCPNLSS